MSGELLKFDENIGIYANIFMILGFMYINKYVPNNVFFS